MTYLFLAAINQYVLRELPSSPVPASCCKALLEACRKFVVDVRSVCVSNLCLVFLAYYDMYKLWHTFSPT